MCSSDLNNIDYGKPEFRRSYDYWRQDEFDYTDIIPQILSNVELPICQNCGYEYKDDLEYEMVKKFNRCLKCGEEGTVHAVNNFEELFKEKIESWKKISLPDLYINILRILYNNRPNKLSAHEIALEIDKHHLAITNAMKKLKPLGYVSYDTTDKRYY